MSSKYIFVVGGVMSSVGKGIASASIGTILKSKGYKVTAIKADPYINVDAGTMNPTEHGEVFVTKDGDECDQDMGNYERFLDESLTKINYMTTGRIYQSVINKERNLDYKGKCVEVVPHIPEEIINRIKTASKNAKADITIIEIGGTIGEYQNLLFLEAARMMKQENPEDVIFILVSYLPIPSKVGEMKTKPTQMASRELNSCGIQTDFIFCRSERPIDQKRREKLATFCGIKPENAISAPDEDSIYDIPVNFENENLGEKILKQLRLEPKQTDLVGWRKMVKEAKEAKGSVKIGIVGKYFDTGDFVLADSYISVIEAVKHASWKEGLKPELVWLSSDKYDAASAKSGAGTPASVGMRGKSKKNLEELKQYDGIIIPGGFGSRGIEGKIAVAGFCRENMIPYFGLCYGMQIATIDFARNVCGLKKANSQELDPKTPHPVIHIMSDQKKKLEEKDFGGSMRLGSYDCKLVKNTLSYRAYSNLKKSISGEPPLISERHRHRYEFNNEYKDLITKKGLKIAGLNPERKLVEIIEIPNHPFFVGVQFHPEFQSRPGRPHPLFLEFIRAARKK
ncbi:MAG: CTP synthase [Patescibacteria group bacterium]